MDGREGREPKIHTEQLSEATALVLTKLCLYIYISLAVTLNLQGGKCFPPFSRINSKNQLCLAVKEEEHWDFSPAGTSGDFGKPLSTNNIWKKLQVGREQLCSSERSNFSHLSLRKGLSTEHKRKCS